MGADFRAAAAVPIIIRILSEENLLSEKFERCPAYKQRGKHKLIPKNKLCERKRNVYRSQL